MTIFGHQAVFRRPSIARHSLLVYLGQRALNIFSGQIFYGHDVKSSTVLLQIPGLREGAAAQPRVLVAAARKGSFSIPFQAVPPRP